MHHQTRSSDADPLGMSVVFGHPKKKKEFLNRQAHAGSRSKLQTLFFYSLCTNSPFPLLSPASVQQPRKTRRSKDPVKALLVAPSPFLITPLSEGIIFSDAHGLPTGTAMEFAPPSSNENLDGRRGVDNALFAGFHPVTSSSDEDLAMEGLRKGVIPVGLRGKPTRPKASVCLRGLCPLPSAVAGGALGPPAVRPSCVWILLRGALGTGSHVPLCLESQPLRHPSRSRSPCSRRSAPGAPTLATATRW